MKNKDNKDNEKIKNRLSWEPGDGYVHRYFLSKSQISAMSQAFFLRSDVLLRTIAVPQISVLTPAIRLLLQDAKPTRRWLARVQAAVVDLPSRSRAGGYKRSITKLTRRSRRRMVLALRNATRT